MTAPRDLYFFFARHSTRFGLVVGSAFRGLGITILRKWLWRREIRWRRGDGRMIESTWKEKPRRQDSAFSRAFRCVLTYTRNAFSSSLKREQDQRSNASLAPMMSVFLYKSSIYSDHGKKRARNPSSLPLSSNLTILISFDAFNISLVFATLNVKRLFSGFLNLRK